MVSELYDFLMNILERLKFETTKFTSPLAIRTHQTYVFYFLQRYLHYLELYFFETRIAQQHIEMLDKKGYDTTGKAQVREFKEFVWIDQFRIVL